MKKNFILCLSVLSLFYVNNTYANTNNIDKNIINQENSKEKTTAEIAFEKALRLNLGLTPEEIKKFREAQDLSNEASVELPTAKIKSGTINISFSQTSPIQPLILTPHYVGAIAFFDAGGNPWAISKAIVGSSKDFELIANSYKIEKNNEENTIPPDAHIMYITSKTNYANSNLIVYLAEAKQPFIIPIESSSSMKNKRIHNGLISYRVDSYSPFSKISPTVDTGTAINKPMLDILDGVNKEATLIKNTYNQNDVQIYNLKNKMYIRTKHNLIFPAPLTKIVVGDRKVYEINKINSIVISIDGKPINIDLID